MNTHLSKITIALLAAPLFTAYAQPTEEPDADVTERIERIVVTASGYETKVIDAPASVTLMTRKDLAMKPIQVWPTHCVISKVLTSVQAKTKTATYPLPCVVCRQSIRSY